MAVELATAYVQIVPSARGLQANLQRELAPISGAAAKEGTKAGQALGGNVAKGLNTSVGKLSGLAAGFGVPFAAQLSTINSRFDLSSAKGENLRRTLSNIGKTSTIAAGVGLAVIGTQAVHAADQFEISHARLETAVRNTGGNFEEAAKGVGILDDRFVKLGFNTSDTENALSRLTAATHNVAEASRLMGNAADIARARNIPLAQATDLLSKAALGNYLGLRRLGIVSKDDIASFHSLGDVTDFLTKKFGGQGAAFAETFAGKMAALKAQANQLEVTIGTALIPKIEALAGGTVGAVQGFEHLNDSTNGLLGKTLAFGAAVPVAVFAIEKLDAAGAAVAAQYSKLGSAFAGADAAMASNAATTEATVVTDARATLARNSLAVATERSAAANAEYDAAMAGYIAATDGGVAAAERLVAAEAEATAALEAQTAAAAEASGANVAGAAAATTAFGGLGLAIAAAAAAVIAFNKNSGRTQWQLFKPGGGVDLNPFDHGGGGGGFSDKDLKAGAEFAQSMKVTQEQADRMGETLKEAQANADAYTSAALGGKDATDQFVASARFVDPTLHQNIDAVLGFHTGIDKLVASLSPAEKASLAAAAANKKYQDDLADSHVPAAQLAADKDNLARTSAREAAIQEKVNAVTNAGAAAANSGKFAYLGLAEGVKTAADALSAISSKAFGSINIGIAADTASAGVSDALAALNDPNAGASGGGSSGGGQTPTAKLLDQIQKNLTLRDSEKGIADAAQAVTDAQTQLTRAQQDQSTATAALKTAQDTYRTTLQGVAKDSQAAKDATDALTSAQNDRASSQLSVREAERNLAKAKNDKDLLALSVADARKKLAEDKNGTAGTSKFVETPTGSKQVTSGGGGADAATIRRDQIALNDAIIDQKGADDTVKRAEIELSNARIQARQKTEDAAEAQRVYNGTINGFPPKSREAQKATEDLTTAQRGAADAARAVKTAQDQLTTATNGTYDAELALIRAHADLDGKLTANPGMKAAGKAADSLTKKTNDAITAIQAFGDTEAAQAADQAKHAGAGIYAATAAGILAEINAIRGAIAGQPLLQHAFDGVFQYLQDQYVAAVSKNAFATGTSLVPGGSGSGHNVLGTPPGFAKGGVVPGPIGAPMLAVVHGGETVVPHHSLANSRPMAVGGGDTYIIHAESIEASRIGAVVVKALQDHTLKRGYIDRVRVSG